MKKLLIFHPTIAPYRIDFFNDLYRRFDSTICLYYENLLDQKFDYEKIREQFVFQPAYFNTVLRLGKRVLPVGHIKRIRENKPDLVMVGEFGFGFWAAVLYRAISRGKYKIISICDDSLAIATRNRDLHSMARAMGLKKADGVILCNEKVADYFRDHYGYENSFVFPIIHNDENYRGDTEALAERANKLIDENGLINKRLFLFVGRISPEKNIEYLINSFIHYHEAYPENRLYLIGDATDSNREYLEKIQNLLAGAGQYIRLLGRKEGEELKSWFVAGQMLVLPSISEAFGAVVNEALLLGEKAAVSSRAGATFLIDDNNGMIFDVEDEYIRFGKLSELVEPRQGHVEEVPNRMPCRYDSLFENLAAWMGSF